MTVVSYIAEEKSGLCLSVSVAIRKYHRHFRKKKSECNTVSEVESQRIEPIIPASGEDPLATSRHDDGSGCEWEGTTWWKGK